MPLAIKIILNYNFFVNKYLTFIEYVIIDNMKNEITKNKWVLTNKGELVDEKVNTK